jgi:homocitrate synthase
MANPMTSTNPELKSRDASRPREPIASPYMPKYPDPMSNISSFKIIESTLRGKQYYI